MKEKIEKGLYKILCFLADNEFITYTMFLMVFMAPLNVFMTVPDPLMPNLAEIDLLKLLLVNLIEILFFWVLVFTSPNCKSRKLKVSNN